MFDQLITIMLAMGDVPQQTVEQTTIDPNGIRDTLGTVSGIVALTMVSVEAVKRMTHNIPYLNKLPNWGYCVGTALVLTYLARYVFGTLSGNFIDLAWSAVITAAGASGFYEWMRQPTNNPETSKTGRVKRDNQKKE